MGRALVQDAPIKDPLIQGEKHTVGVLGDAAATLTYDHPDVLSITPTAARTLTMPADDATKRGRVFHLCNLAAATHAITINNSSAASVGSVPAAKNALIVLEATGTWRVFVSA